jgi:hypothetical protein
MISSERNGTSNGAGHNGTANGTTVNGAAPGTGSRRMLIPAPDSSVNPAELSDLARELAAAFGEIVSSYRKHCKLSAEEAVKRAEENSAEEIERILNCPPDEVTFFDMDALAQKDESLALQRWTQIKEAARNEIRSGYRSARVVEDGGGLWERARFLAVRAELMEDWRPRNAVEQHLVDQLAQWQVLLWRWQEAMTTWSNCAAHDVRQEKKGVPYEKLRLCEAKALERATKKVELLRRLYLRTLKALQDQRRPHPSIAVRHAEQVNVSPIRISADNLALPSPSSEVAP